MSASITPTMPSGDIHDEPFEHRPLREHLRIRIRQVLHSERLGTQPRQVDHWQGGALLVGAHAELELAARTHDQERVGTGGFGFGDALAAQLFGRRMWFADATWPKP